MKSHNLSSLRVLGSVGEPLNQEAWQWFHQVVGGGQCDLVDTWWQTETGHALTSTCVGLGHSLAPPKDVSGMAVPGWDIRILRDDQTEARAHELGRIVAKLPMPPGCMSTLFGADQRYKETYFQNYPGYYDTMDAGIKDEHGYIKVQIFN